MFAREGEQFGKFTRKERKKEEKPAKTRKGEFWPPLTLWCDPLCRNARLSIWFQPPLLIQAPPRPRD